MKLKHAGTVCALLLGLLVMAPGPVALRSAEPSRNPRPQTAKPPPGSEIFDKPTVLDFQVQLVETNFQALRSRPGNTLLRRSW